MYFKRLEMQGFKSFADPVVIDFHEGITCVVGPNGSGKSNISDAIRWVLGEQSPKNLRGSKMEEVIFAGTANRKSRGMAEVTLVIDNSTHILDIDYNEVGITRRVYRSGDSEYLINNNPCRLRDIRELIMDTGIGVDGYSIIGQGKIADIVSTKPEARREIFEEAAGIVMYKTKRQDAEKKLESTTANLERVQDIIGEIEDRIDGLREDSIKAKEYLELKKNYEGLEVNIILRNIENIVETSDVYENDLLRLAKEIEQATRDHEGVSTKSAELAERRELLDKLMGEANENILKLVQEINEITNASQLSAERLSGIEKESELINSDLQMLQERLAAEKTGMEKLQTEKDSLDRDIDKAKSELEDKILAYNEAASVQANLVESADEGRRKLFDLNSEKTSCESEIKGIENIKENLLSRKEELGSLSSETGKVSDELRRTVEEKSLQKDEMEKSSEALNAELAELESKREASANRIRELREGIERDKLEIGTLSSRRRTMEEMESNYDGYAAGVISVMKSNLSGIKGVVAELMDVPRGYETAIETALGGKLQNIICQRDEDAKRAVEHLKSTKGGRATFLPIETIRAQGTGDIAPIKDHPGFVDLANNLISFDSELTDIFSYLLGRTAVTKDIDAAIELAKMNTGLKFVTLEGEIVNSRGAITGGALQNKSANILERKSEINLLAETIEKLNNQYKNNEQVLNSENDALTSYMNRQQEASGEKHRLDIELSALISDIKAITDNLDKEKLNIDRYDSEMTRIEEQLGETEKMTESHKNRIIEIQKQIEEVTRSIDDATQMAEQGREDTEAKSEQVTKARIALNEIETRGESQQRLYDRVKDQIDQYESQIREKEDTLETLSAEKKELLHASAQEKDIEAKLSERAAIEEGLGGLQQDRENILTEIKELETHQGEALERMNNLRDQKYQIEIKAARGETQLETLKEKLWDEFEITYAQAEDLRTEDFVYSRAVKESREIRNRIKALGDVNVGAIEEYEHVSERYEFLTSQRDDINKAKDELETIIDDMDKTIKIRFKENFDQVVDNFHNIFTELFGGGQAELRLENEDDPLNSGIDIIAQPPGKKLQNINLMSGGEKTMTAIALMFAVLKAKPTPFCILDEVEAALDDTNIDRFANYLKNFNEIQFTLVTHQKATMEHADVLYGVTMPEQGISKMLSLRLGDEFELD